MHYIVLLMEYCALLFTILGTIFISEMAVDFCYRFLYQDNVGHAHTSIFIINNWQGPAVESMELYSRLYRGLDGSVVWGEWIHVYLWLIPFILQLKLSQHCLLIEYTPIKSRKFKIYIYMNEQKKKDYASLVKLSELLSIFFLE